MLEKRASIGSGWSIKIDYAPKDFDELKKVIALLKKQIPTVQVDLSDSDKISAASDKNSDNGHKASQKQWGKLWIMTRDNGFGHPSRVFKEVYPDDSFPGDALSSEQASACITYLQNLN